MVERDGDGVLRFSVFAPEAKRVQLVGCFTGWGERPIEMIAKDEGWYTTEIELGPGDYEFQYLIDGKTWLADYAAGGVKMNVFGNWVSQLHVSRRLRPTWHVAGGAQSAVGQTGAVGGQPYRAVAR